MTNSIKLMNVTALWPRLDKAYKFDAAAMRSVPTDPTDQEGSYEINLMVTAAQGKELAAKMTEAFAAFQKENSAAQGKEFKASDTFKKDDSGCFIVKSKKKTYGDPGSKPRQWMQDGSRAPDDFQLTTNSKVHAELLIKPWAYAGKVGVTLRPQNIMVVELAERMDGGDNPFASEAKSDNPFGLPSANESIKTGNSLDLDDEIPF